MSSDPLTEPLTGTEDIPPAPEPGLIDLIRSDLDRFSQTFRLRGQPYSSTRVFWESFLFKASFQAALGYRISHWLYRRGWIYPAWFVTRMNLWWTGAEIEFNARIGPGLFVTHPVGVVIGRGTVIGRGATIFQGTTFGVKSWHPDDIRRFPTVGDDCFFFAHCVVLGGVTIGDGSVVAAQALVTRDMPPGSLARGIPAEIHPEMGRTLLESWLS